MKNKKEKGNSFEREIARQLSLWWSDGTNDFVFWRSASSGGMATVRTKKNKQTKGQYDDLCAVDEVGKPFIQVFTTEIKRGYPGATIQDLLDRPSGGTKGACYRDWIAKAKKTSEAAGSKSWMIIHRRDKAKAIVTMPLLTANQFEAVLYWPPKSSICVFLESDIHKEYFTCLLDEFLELVKREDVIELSKKL